MEQMMEFMKGLDWSPLLISLKTGVVATILSFFGGIYAARQVVKAGPKTKAVMDGILTLPMVLPPTVAGFFLLLSSVCGGRLVLHCMEILESRWYRPGLAVFWRQR